MKVRRCPEFTPALVKKFTLLKDVFSEGWRKICLANSAGTQMLAWYFYSILFYGDVN